MISRRDQFSNVHPEQRHSVNGRSWGAIALGDTGPALVLLPGTLGRADIFWNQIDALQGQVRILALSYPATGSIEEWVVDIRDLMQMHSIEKATVLGSSLGGYVAQYFTAIYPEMADNLIAANTLPSTAILANTPPYNADIDAIPADQLMAAFRKGLLEWAVDEPDRADLVDLLLAEVAGRIPETELRSRLKALQGGPVLPAQTLSTQNIYTVESSDDRLIPQAVSDGLRAQLDPVQTMVFEQGSHFPYITEPVRYIQMLRDILGLQKDKQ